MNRIVTDQDQQAWEKTLSDAEMWELLSVRGITVSRTAEILKAKSPITVSSSLKKIGMKNHFSELPPQGTTRIIKLTNAWVMALLETLKPETSKKSTASKNVSPLKPREPGIFFADFQKELWGINAPGRPNATVVWNYLVWRHPELFAVATPKGKNKPAYQLKEVHKKCAMDLAKEYIRRGDENVSKRNMKEMHAAEISERTLGYFSHLNHG